MLRRCLVVLLVAVTACGGKKSSGRSIHVAAASDLQRAFEEVSKAFKAKTGIDATVTPGSSGLLAKQIAEGAPFDLFAAANVGYVDEVVAKGACDGATVQIYARGRIVVWSKGAAPAKLEDLADGKYQTIAIANPDHAPYGKAAQQALESVGIWDQVKGRIVRGENVLQAMQDAKSGNADVAIVALSLAVEADGGSMLTINPSLYKPLDQAMVVCGKGEAAGAAAKFADFVMSPEGREIMNRYGFQLPGEAAQHGAEAPRAPPPPLATAAVQAAVDAWLAAQNHGDLAAYQALYAEKFSGVRRTGARTHRFDRKGWFADREKMFKMPMTVTVAGVEIHPSAGSAVVRFDQTFESGKFKDTGAKQLVIVEGPDGLRIAREEMLQSTVISGPGSAQATGFAVLAAGQPWLVVGDGAGVATTGVPAMASGGAADYVVVEEPSGLAERWTKLVGQPVTLFPSGASCTVAGFRVLTLLTPHFGTVAEWNDAQLAGDALTRAVLDGGGAEYLVADIAGCGGHDGDQLGTIGKSAVAWAPASDPALEQTVIAAFRALPGYQELQDDYVQSYGGTGPWTESDEGAMATSIVKSPDGTQTYAIVGARAGTGCGDFSGDLTVVFRLDGTVPTPVGTLSGDGASNPPTTLVDTNGDGHPEVAGFAALWAWDGKSYAPAYQLDLGFRDCGC